MNHGFKIRQPLRAMSAYGYAKLVAYIVFTVLMLNSLYGVISLVFVGHYLNAVFSFVGAVYLNFIVALWYVDMIRNSKHSIKHVKLSSAWKWTELFLLAGVIMLVSLKLPKLMVYLSIIAFFELVVVEPYMARFNRKRDEQNAINSKQLQIIEDGNEYTKVTSYVSDKPKTAKSSKEKQEVSVDENSQEQTVLTPRKPSKKEIERVLDDFNSEVSYFLGDKYDEAVDGRVSDYHDASSYEISEQYGNHESVYAPDGMIPEFELSYDEKKNEIDVFSSANGAGLESYPLKKGVALEIESDAHWFIADDTAWTILSELDNVI